jgi:hypothetical protein
MHDTAVQTANFYRTQTSGTGRLDNACSAWLRYDSFQLLSSATMQDVRKPGQTFKRSRSKRAHGGS